MHGHDLRALLQRFDAELTAGITTPPPSRDELACNVVMLDDASCRVRAQMAIPAAFIDGIQSAVTLAWRSARPVGLQFAGAGAAVGGKLVAVHEQMRLVCALEDEEWVRDAALDVPVHVVEGETPSDVVRNVAECLGTMRETLERELCGQLLEELDDQPGVIVCDGSIVGRSVDPRVCGVVKTTARRYLGDESELWKLPKGWRSARFSIPAGVDMGVERHSCYVRLHDARRRPWDFALIRVETFDADMCESVAALALADAQDGSRSDARWDRHLRSVRNVEDLMRARRPALFS